MPTDNSLRDALVFHAGFAAVCAVGLWLPAPALGWRLLALVALYNAALPLAARARGHPGWVRLWAFLVPVSAGLVVPDLFLADVLGSLDFPDTGGPRLGPVPLAMAGMWTVPLWVALFLADRQRGGLARRAAWASAVGAVVLVASEATLWAVPIWRAVGVVALGPVAVYVVGPLALLGGVAYVAFALTRRGPAWARLAAAAVVPLVYLGALAASYLLVERALP